MHQILVISTDLGARVTGVFTSLYPPGGDPAERPHGHVFTFDPNDFQLGQRNRTLMRHMRRGVKRRKLAKRLVTLWLERMRPAQFGRLSPAERGYLRGLMNRRGFTYFSLDEAIDDSEMDVFSAEFFELLAVNSPATSLSQWLREAIADPGQIAGLLQQPAFTLEDGKRKAERAFSSFAEEKLREGFDARIPRIDKGRLGRPSDLVHLSACCRKERNS